MELRNYQTDAVESVSKFIQNNVGRNVKRACLLQAPTGSGKTVMASSIIERNNNVIYLFVSPAKGGLSKQTFEKLNVWNEGVYYAEPSTIQRVPYLQAGETIVIPWESVNKDGNVLVAEGEDRNLFDLLDATAATGTEVVIIVDEAHLAKSVVTKAQAFLRRVEDTLGYSPMTIEVTATPSGLNKAGSGGVYEETIVRYADVVAEQMIVENIVLNEGFAQHTDQNDDDIDTAVIDLAIAKLQEIASQVSWKPALLIQISNGDAGTKQRERIVIPALEKHGYTEANGKVAFYLSTNKTNGIEDAVSPDSDIEVIVFKQGLTEGWDLPRAKVLAGFRESKSSIFKAQVAGRIMRMPEHKHYDNPALNLGYIYTSLDESNFNNISGDFDAGYIKDATLRYRGPSFSLPASLVRKEIIETPTTKDIKKFIPAVDQFDSIDFDAIVNDPSVMRRIISDATMLDGEVFNDTEDAHARVSDTTIQIEFDDLIKTISPFDVKTSQKVYFSWARRYGSFDPDLAMKAFIGSAKIRDAFATLFSLAANSIGSASSVETFDWVPPKAIAASTDRMKTVQASAQRYMYVDADDRPKFRSELSGPEENFIADNIDRFDAWMKNGEVQGDFSIALPNGSNHYPDFILLKNDVPLVIEIKDSDDKLGAGSEDSRVKAQALADWSRDNDIPAGLAYQDKKSKTWKISQSDDPYEDILLEDFLA